MIREQPGDAGPHQRVDILPIDLTGFLFNDPEATIAVRHFDIRFFERAENVNVAGRFCGYGFNRRIAFNGDEIHSRRHIEVVELLMKRAQIDSDWMIGAKLAQHIGLHSNEGDNGIAAKPVPVQQQRRVVRHGCGHGHGHVVERGNDLSQITQTELVVESLNSLVLQLQPILPFEA